MKEFTQQTGFIVTFLIGTIFLQITAGKKMTEAFLWLVLLSMLAMNPQKFKNLIEKGVNNNG